MTDVCKLLTVFIFYVFCEYSLSTENVYSYTLPIYESVLLQCGQMQNQIEWKFQGDLLFMGGFLLRDDLLSSVSLLQNNSLHIFPISLLHIGKYECITNKGNTSTYILDVEGL